MNRRDFVKLASSGLAGLLLPETVMAQQSGPKIIDHLSPRRRTRAGRLSTDHIILHTTEAYSGRSSLNTLTPEGKANYMIDTNGEIYGIMNRNQISIGSGRSMWNGKTNLDNHVVNIEFVGYHNRQPTRRQFESGKQLIQQLQGIYTWIDDNEVMPHSMVAYDVPNEWHRNSHRGRKRCGMLFAQEDVREKLGLGKAPESDPDVRAGRLVVGDDFLEDVLYEGKTREIASSREHADEPEAVISTINRGESPWTYAGDEYADSTTTYFLPNGHVRRGDELQRQGFDFNSVQPGTKIAVGYVYGGHVYENRRAFEVTRRRWNLPSTIYRLPNGEIKTGDEINEGTIPRGTLVLFRR